MSADSAQRALRQAAETYAKLVEKTLGSNLVSIVLFGSVARGEAHSDSDIDLLIVADWLPSGRFARLAVLEPAEAEFETHLLALYECGIHTRISRVVKTSAEADKIVPLYLDFVEDAILLYDRNHMFANVLERLRHRLRELGSERRQLGKTRYWVLKPDIRPGEVFEL